MALERTDIERLYSLARPHAKKIGLGMGMSVLSTAVGLGIPLGIKELLDSVLAEGDHWLLNLLALALFGLVVIQAVTRLYGGFWLGTAGERIVADLRADLFARMLSLKVPFYDEMMTGDLTSRLNSDVATIERAATEHALTALRAGISLVGSVALMVAINWKVALLVSVAAPGVGFASRRFGNTVRKLSEKVQDQLAAATAHAEEALRGVRTVKAFRREVSEAREYRDRVERVYQAAETRVWKGAAFQATVGALTMSMVTIIFWLGGREVLAGTMSIGALVAFFFYAMKVSRAGRSIAGLYEQYSEIAGATDRVFELLDRKGEYSSSKPGEETLHIDESVCFENVSFGYNEAEVLRNVNFEVTAGESVVFVGPSGSGKTTIAELLLGFYEPDSGVITLDGVPLDEVGRGVVRSNCGVVRQDVTLFDRTVADNIKYGTVGAGRRAVIRAAKVANAHSFIIEMRNGYETRVGEDGARISGGQIKRIGLARAIVGSPELVVLDEPLVSLDAEAEESVIKGLQQVMASTTAIVISHRSNALRWVDRVLAVDYGTVSVVQEAERPYMKRGVGSAASG